MLDIMLPKRTLVKQIEVRTIADGVRGNVYLQKGKILFSEDVAAIKARADTINSAEYLAKLKAS